MQPGEWHQYALVWDESAQRLYIDGALVATSIELYKDGTLWESSPGDSAIS